MSEEPWLGGPVAGIIAELQPVAHELLFAQQELARIFERLRDEHIWQTPNGAASIGFHMRHCAGSTLRMLTYARGDALSEAQLADLAAEKHADQSIDVVDLLAIANHAIEEALRFLRTIHDGSVLDQPRLVGRKKLESNVRGLLYEIAIHTSRHVGQIATTARVIGAQ